MIGNNVAHSKLRTKRDFALNLKTKRFWSESEQRLQSFSAKSGDAKVDKTGKGRLFFVLISDFK